MKVLESFARWRIYVRSPSDLFQHSVGAKFFQQFNNVPLLFFSRQADKLFSEDEKRELIAFLAENPLAGDEIPGTGGVRKLRFAALGRGQRGGARVIYCYMDETMPVYALLAYAKTAKTDMTPDERRTVSKLAAALKAARKRR